MYLRTSPWAPTARRRSNTPDRESNSPECWARKHNGGGAVGGLLPRHHTRRVTAWDANCSAADRKNLQSVTKTAQSIARQLCLRTARKTAARLDNVKVKRDGRCLTSYPQAGGQAAYKKQDWKSEKHVFTIFFIYNSCHCTGWRMTDILLCTCAILYIL